MMESFGKMSIFVPDRGIKSHDCIQVDVVPVFVVSGFVTELSAKSFVEHNFRQLWGALVG
jgi:hypothetical protein